MSKYIFICVLNYYIFRFHFTFLCLYGTLMLICISCYNGLTVRACLAVGWFNGSIYVDDVVVAVVVVVVAVFVDVWLGAY